MAFPNGVGIVLVWGGQRHQFLATWSDERSDPKLIVPAEEVAKEVDVALGHLKSFVLKGILEGFPAPAAAPPTLVDVPPVLVNVAGIPIPPTAAPEPEPPEPPKHEPEL